MNDLRNSAKQTLSGLVALLHKNGVLNAYIPRWIILLLDLMLISFSFVLLFVLLKLLLEYPMQPGIETRFAVVISVYTFYELILRVYRGTVRFSGLSEIVRLFMFIMLSVLTIGVSFSFLKGYFKEFDISLFWIFAHGAIAFFLLFCLRVGVKYSFYFLSTAYASRNRVLVFGADANSLALAQMLSVDSASVYKPVALIDTEHNFRGIRLGSIPVVQMPESKEKLTELMEKYRVDQLIFREEQLKGLPGETLDRLLEAKLRLLVIGGATDLKDHDQKARLSVNEIKIEDLLNRAVIKTENSVVAEKHRERVVLVTGAAGSIGSEVVMQVAQFGPKKLILLDQAESPLHEMELRVRGQYPDLEVVIFIGDVRNRQRMEQLFELYAPEVIYHAAAYKHVPMMERYPAEAIRVNVMGTRLMADLAVKYNTRKFVMVSTDKAVNPTNVMGASKRIAEIYVQSLYSSLAHLSVEHKKRTRFITTRFGNVLGSNGSVVPLFKRQIAKGGPVTVTHKDIIRYFMTIPEACRLVLEAGCMGRGGEIFVFDMGEPVRIYDLAKRMISLSGLTPGKDIAIVETGLRPGEKLYEELLNDKESTLPTHHEKIMVAKVREYDYREVCLLIDGLVKEALDGHDDEVVRRMKLIVPEFKSRNSVYEKFDVESDHPETLASLHEVVHES